MNSSSRIRQLVLTTSAVLLFQAVGFLTAHADNPSLRFQRPGSARAQRGQVNKKFRRPGLEREAPAKPKVRQASAPNVERETKTSTKRQATKKRTTKKRVVAELPPAFLTEEPLFPAEQPVRRTAAKVVKKKRPVRRDPQLAQAGGGQVEYESEFMSELRLASYGCSICDGPCACEVGCGVPEASCGMYEPGCGIVEPSCGCGEPSCGICEPGCGIAEPACGIAEPSCGCGDVGCGSCVAISGPDYWCFPVCLPRFKDLSVSAGVQGFRGPRDFAGGRSDSNFGFNQSINLSGRAPFIGLLFPQLSYQLGYRAIESRLYGTTTSTNSRSQQFVTAGLFRRVHTGLQYGLVWDLMEDNLDEDLNIHQLRGEFGLKSPQGREIGFWFTSGTKDRISSGTLYETVDQFAFFYRWGFGNGYEGRLWGGATGDSEGLFGGEFFAPLNNRWSLQSGFNFLIPDEDAGPVGVSQESWNVGVNMVWHLGKKARSGCRSPFRPLFSVADNGWMFVDQAQ